MIAEITKSHKDLSAILMETRRRKDEVFNSIQTVQANLNQAQNAIDHLGNKFDSADLGDAVQRCALLRQIEKNQTLSCNLLSEIADLRIELVRITGKERKLTSAVSELELKKRKFFEQRDQEELVSLAMVRMVQASGKAK